MELCWMIFLRLIPYLETSFHGFAVTADHMVCHMVREKEPFWLLLKKNESLVVPVHEERLHALQTSTWDFCIECGDFHHSQHSQ
jgi:hypothetical protein